MYPLFLCNGKSFWWTRTLHMCSEDNTKVINRCIKFQENYEKYFTSRQQQFNVHVIISQKVRHLFSFFDTKANAHNTCYTYKFENLKLVSQAMCPLLPFISQFVLKLKNIDSKELNNLDAFSRIITVK